MFRRISPIGLVALLIALTGACAAQYTGPPADLVVLNAKIVTIDEGNPRAKAVAVIGEEIVAVGSNRAIRAYIEEGTTEVIDAGGRLMIPGFNDAHAHYGPLDPDYINNIAAAQQRLERSLQQLIDDFLSGTQ